MIAAPIDTNNKTNVKSISACDLTKNLTMNVKVANVDQLKARIWIGTKLIILAARIMGCGIEIDTESKANNKIKKK